MANELNLELEASLAAADEEVARVREIQAEAPPPPQPSAPVEAAVDVDDSDRIEQSNAAATARVIQLETRVNVSHMRAFEHPPPPFLWNVTDEIMTILFLSSEVGDSKFISK